MNLKKPMKESRRGSYLVEASLTLPIYILGITALALIISITAFCETAGFVISREMKEDSYSEKKLVSSISLSRNIISGVEQEWQNRLPLSEFKVNRVRNGVKSGSLDELCTVNAEAEFTVFSSIGIGGNAVFSEKVMARAFTGCIQDAVPLDAAEFTEGGAAMDVTVYPRYGQRFHTSTCSIVQQEQKEGNPGWVMDREEAQRQDFTPCRICGGGMS